MSTANYRHPLKNWKDRTDLDIKGDLKELITQYINQRPEAKRGEQYYAIPRRKNDIIDEQVTYYDTPSRKRTAVIFTREIGIELNYILFKRANPKVYKELEEGIYKVEDLIASGYIHPFVLLLNGRMIRWEYMKLVTVTEKYYIIISGMDQIIFDKYFTGVIPDMEFIELPENVSYKDGNFPITDRTLFAFDNEGAFVDEGEARTIIETLDENIEIKRGKCEDGIFYISNNMKNYYDRDCVFCFSNRLSKFNNVIDNIGPIVCINGGNITAKDNLYITTFYNKYGTPTYDHLARVDFDAIKYDAVSYLKNNANIPYMELLKKPFDLNVYREYYYDKNYNDALNYIAEYDHLLYNEYYKSIKNFMHIDVDYEWLESHKDEDGYLCIPRRFDHQIDFYIIVFVNGELYQFYRNSFYKFGTFYCPTTGITPEDKIEIWYFMGAKNHNLYMNIDKDEPYLPLDTDYYYIRGETKIFTKFTNKHNFRYPYNGLHHFPVKHDIQYDLNKKRLRVRFDDPEYYGNDMILTSDNRFVYYPLIVNLPDGVDYYRYCSIDLGEKFMYCNEYDRFLVFYNGRRLMNTHYRLVIPCKDSTPFYRFQIYLNRKIKNGDRIEIFYLPIHFMDIYADYNNMDDNGKIQIPKELLWHSLDNELYTYWLNGKKINGDDIACVDSNTVQLLKDQHTLKTLRVTTMVDDTGEYEELKRRFAKYKSEWDEIVDISSIDPLSLQGIDPPEHFTDTESEFFTDAVSSTGIMRELLRDWYLCNPGVDIWKPFHYDYDEPNESVIMGHYADCLLLDPADCTTYTNLDVERPEF